ncbi:MAG: cytochrome c [Candidatus Rokubacteria bacterium]|nr:cytochrome c [Candidatus Rokubacteria bacterium]
MRWAVAAVACLLLWSPGAARAQPLFSPSQDPVAGSRVFGAKGCVKCHSVNGVGGKIGPDLGRIPRPRSFYDLTAAMWNHLPEMAERMRQFGIARPHLDPRETGDLIAFLYTLNYFDPAGDVEAGHRLFTEKKCVVCHQVGGTGGVVGPNLDGVARLGSPILVAAAMWNHGPAMAEAMRVRKIERPSFKDSELLDLIAYLRSAAPAPTEGPLYVLPGRAEEGRRLFAERRCVLCHSAGGEGGRVGPDLVERGLHRSLTQFAAAMWNKAPKMMEAMKARGIAVPPLQAEEMADLVAYLYSVRYFAEPGDPARGRQLVGDKRCLGCHSVSGAGGKVAGDLARLKGLDAPGTVIAALWNHSFIMEHRAERRKVSWPKLRPEEMADLVAFLQAQGRPR